MDRIALVTPSLNQARYLGRAVADVFGQEGAPAVDYVVLDGGSSDGSVALLEQLAPQAPAHIRFRWLSRPDGGQYPAIAAGFALAEGDVMGWLNADDRYAPWALALVRHIFDVFPQVEWLTSAHPLTFEAHDGCVGVDVRRGYSRAVFLRGGHLPGQGWPAHWFIQQDCTFWRRSLWQRAGGGFDPSLRLAADFELWARFFDLTPLYALAAPLAGYRRHPAQKTADQGAYDAEARQVLERRGGRPPRGMAAWLRGSLAPRLAVWPTLLPCLRRVGLAEGVPYLVHAGRGQGWRLTQRDLVG